MVQRGTRCMVACGRVLGDSVWSGCTPFGCMWTGAGGQCVEWVSPLWVHVDGCWGTVCGVGVPPLGACGWSAEGRCVEWVSLWVPVDGVLGVSLWEWVSSLDVCG